MNETRCKNCKKELPGHYICMNETFCFECWVKNVKLKKSGKGKKNVLKK